MDTRRISPVIDLTEEGAQLRSDRNIGQRDSAAVDGSFKSADQSPAISLPANSAQQLTAVKPASEPVAPSGPAPDVCRRWGTGEDQCLLRPYHLGPCVTSRGQTLPLYHRMPGK